MSQISVVPGTRESLAASRASLLAHVDFQVVRDSAMGREGVEGFLFVRNGETIGHAVVSHGFFPDRVVEFHLMAGAEGWAVECLRLLRQVTVIREMEAQTNLPLPTWLVHQFGQAIRAENVLFRDTERFDLNVSDAVLRLAEPDDAIPTTTEPAGPWVLEVNGTVVGSGGYLTHYNPPFADIYMGIGESFRGCGYGEWIVQELRRVTREHGFQPAARCAFDNTRSMRALLRGGFQLAGLILVGALGPGDSR